MLLDCFSARSNTSSLLYISSKWVFLHFLKHKLQNVIFNDLKMPRTNCFPFKFLFQHLIFNLIYWLKSRPIYQKNFIGYYHAIIKSFAYFLVKCWYSRTFGSAFNEYLFYLDTSQKRSIAIRFTFWKYLRNFE